MKVAIRLWLLAIVGASFHNLIPPKYLHFKGNTWQWAVKLRASDINSTRILFDELAEQIAREHDLLNHGQVGELIGHYLFTRRPDEESTELREFQLEQKFKRHPHVEYYSPQVLLNRKKRYYVPKAHEGFVQMSVEERVLKRSPLQQNISMSVKPRAHKLTDKMVKTLQNLVPKFEDPEFGNQWHLFNRRYPGNDCNVTGVWGIDQVSIRAEQAMNVTGNGVTVAVVDDGVQWDHPDLLANYNPKGSFDLNSNDDNPMPQYDENEENKHGTRCAGEIAAVPNDVCGVGVSFGAKFSGIRVLDGPITDSMEATAFNKHLDINDIYSCSWGPEDDAKTLDGPHPLAQAALIHGVTAGRRGFGSIYIVASGNGGNEGDNCNFDGYANSIYTITIGAVDERGDMPYYAEECASMLASTFSSGNPSGRDTRKIVTTDWTMGRSGSGTAGAGCTASHTGTSAATPLAAGMVALMLQVRPCLTWRDVQHIIVYTARHTKGTHKPKNVRSWFTNKAGLQHSAQYGFGLLDAWRLVNAAKVWRTTPMLTSFSPPTIGYNEKIRTNDYLRLHAAVSDRDAALHRVITLEHVQVTLTIEHRKRGDIEVSIVCPSGTESLVGPNRAKDTSSLGFKDWTFSTVRCWGESSIGNFYLIVRDRGVIDHGILRYWKLTLYGSSVTPEDVQERRREVEDSYSGEKLDPASNFSIPCPPGESVPFDITEAISDRTLKLLALMSGLFVFWSIYFTIEMAFCNTDEKVLLVDPDEEVDSSDSFVDPTRAPTEHVVANNSK